MIAPCSPQWPINAATIEQLDLGQRRIHALDDLVGAVWLFWNARGCGACERNITDKPTLVSVYDGRRLLGFILNRGADGFEAFDAAERSLGVFNTIKAAADAISAEASP